MRRLLIGVVVMAGLVSGCASKEPTLAEEISQAASTEMAAPAVAEESVNQEPMGATSDSGIDTSLPVESKPRVRKAPRKKAAKKRVAARKKNKRRSGIAKR